MQIEWKEMREGGTRPQLIVFKQNTLSLCTKKEKGVLVFHNCTIQHIDVEQINKCFHQFCTMSKAELDNSFKAKNNSTPTGGSLPFTSPDNMNLERCRNFHSRLDATLPPERNPGTVK